MTEFHEEMDALSMQLVVLSQDLVTKKLEVENWQKQGVLCMAQARNAMGGPSTISQMQYPSEEMTASVRTNSDECVRAKSSVDGNVRFPYLSISEDTVKKNDLGVKRRKNIEELTADLSIQDDGKSDTLPSSDPLKWFGILVPNSLRQSQKCFKKAIDHSIDCVNIQNEINGIIARRKYLLRTKGI